MPTVLRVLPLLGKTDLLLTDPPYGINAYGNGTMGGGVLAKQSKFKPTEWDKQPPEKWVLEMLISKTANQIIWGGNYFGLPPSNCWLVWDKDNGENNFADCELAWTSFQTAVRYFKWKWQGMLQEDMKNKEVRVHPTQKPLALMEWCIKNYSEERQTILDPYAGSGTTLVAAKRLGRFAIGIEREQSYVDKIIDRLRQRELF